VSKTIAKKVGAWAAKKAAEERTKKKVADDGVSEVQPADPPQPEAEKVDMYWDLKSKSFWGLDYHGKWIQFDKGQVKTLLKLKNFSEHRYHGRPIHELDFRMLEIQLRHNVDFAGPLGGYPAGTHKIGGFNILVSSGFKLQTPKRGTWRTLKTLVQQLLGKQAVYFYGWCKSAIAALRAGPLFAPGQMLAVAGPSGCGKSYLQIITTEILGGRGTKADKVITGRTDFNNHLFGSEHIYLEDSLPANDIKSRRAIGAEIKKLLVNQVQEITKKGCDALCLTPFVRLSVSLNEDANNLLVLPPYEPSTWEKIILLKASPATFPYEAGDLAARHRHFETIKAEIPAFLWHLDQWKIPPELRDKRYGVKSWHNPELLEELFRLSPEKRLLDIIDTSGILEGEVGCFIGTSRDLEAKLRENDRTGEVSGLLSYHTACGQLLRKLAEKHPERVSVRETGGHKQEWTILHESAAGGDARE
jgi:hypothetical protein